MSYALNLEDYFRFKLAAFWKQELRGEGVDYEELMALEGELYIFDKNFAVHIVDEWDVANMVSIDSSGKAHVESVSLEFANELLKREVKK